MEADAYADGELPNRFEEWDGRLHPDDRERVLTRLWTYFDGVAPDYEVEFRLRHKDGSYRWILARGAAVRGADGKPFRLAGSHTDITDPRHVEGERQKFVSLVEHTNDYVGMADLDGRVAYLNRAARELVGLEGDADLSSTHIPDHCAQGFVPFVQDEILPGVMANGQWGGEFQLRHFQTQRSIDMLGNVFLVRHPETGEPVGIAGANSAVAVLEREIAGLRPALAEFIEEAIT